MTSKKLITILLISLLCSTALVKTTAKPEKKGCDAKPAATDCKGESKKNNASTNTNNKNQGCAKGDSTCD